MISLPNKFVSAESRNANCNLEDCHAEYISRKGYQHKKSLKDPKALGQVYWKPCSFHTSLDKNKII